MYHNSQNYRLTNNDGWVQVGRPIRPSKPNYIKSTYQNKREYDNYIEYKPQNNMHNITKKIDDNNYKKTLCKNINNIGKCIYGNKCLFAHNID